MRVDTRTSMVSVITVGLGISENDAPRTTNEQQRALISFDKDFGDLVLRSRTETKDVILSS